MVIKQRKCKECREKYTPVRPMQVGCGYDCDLALALKAAVKARIKRERDYDRETNRRKKAIREAKPAWWEAKLKLVCHLYIRTRDALDPCPSCGCTETAQWDAGHFIPSHRGSALRYDERNIHKQCCVCNDGSKGSGNLTQYRIGLVKKIGVEQVEELERIGHTIKRWTIPELQELIIYYKAKLRELKNV